MPSSAPVSDFTNLNHIASEFDPPSIMVPTFLPTIQHFLPTTQPFLTRDLPQNISIENEYRLYTLERKASQDVAGADIGEGTVSAIALLEFNSGMQKARKAHKVHTSHTLVLVE